MLKGLEGGHKPKEKQGRKVCKGVKLPSQRKPALDKGLPWWDQGSAPGSHRNWGVLWSGGEIRDPSQVACALHLGFASRLPKAESITPLARASLRKRGSLCCLACIRVCYLFLHHLFFRTWLTSGKPQSEVVHSWSMASILKMACSSSLCLQGSKNLLVPCFTTINKHCNHPQQSWLGCNQVRNVSLTSTSQTLGQLRHP